MDTYEVWDYLKQNELDQQFAELNAQEVADLKALGVPEIDDPLPRGEGYVYAGSVCFQWLDEPVIIHY